MSRERPSATYRLLGYLMIVTASMLFGVNGNLSRLLFDDGISPITLVELRMLIGGVCLLTVLIVGRRKDITRHRRFAKIDTPLPAPSATRAPRHRKPTAAALRAFLAGLEQEARERAPRGARKLGRSRPPERWSRRAARRAVKQ